MGKVAVVTDSNSGITQSEASALGITVLPMPFFMNGETYYEDVNLTQEQFYEMLEGGAEISTSMPAVGDVTDQWDRLLEEYDGIVHIPMSSGLSSSCETAYMLAQSYDGKVQVVNNQRISVTQKRSVLDALELLRLKPVLQIQGEKLDAFAKARTVKQAKTIMTDAMADDCKNRFHDPSGSSLHIDIAYTHDREAALQFEKEVKEVFPDHECVVNPLSLSVSCHIGPGALAIACSHRIKV